MPRDTPRKKRAQCKCGHRLAQHELAHNGVAPCMRPGCGCKTYRPR